MRPPSNVRAQRVVPWALLLSGAGLVGWAVASGSARVALLLVVPVVTGTSLVFLVGVLLLVLGFLSVPFAFAPEPRPVPTLPSEEAVSPPGRSGAVVLIGPFPFFFGSFRSAPRWVRWAAALAGAAFVVLFVLAVLSLG